MMVLMWKSGQSDGLKCGKMIPTTTNMLDSFLDGKHLDQESLVLCLEIPKLIFIGVPSTKTEVHSKKVDVH
jgi:hypothetical protein